MKKSTWPSLPSSASCMFQVPRHLGWIPVCHALWVMVENRASWRPMAAWITPPIGFGEVVMQVRTPALPLTSLRITCTAAPALSRVWTTSRAAGLSVAERPGNVKLRAPRLNIHLLRLRPRPPEQPIKTYDLLESNVAVYCAGTAYIHQSTVNFRGERDFVPERCFSDSASMTTLPILFFWEKKRYACVISETSKVLIGTGLTAPARDSSRASLYLLFTSLAGQG